MDITTVVLNQTKTLRTTRNVMKLSERPRSRNYTTDPRDNVNQIFSSGQWRWACFERTQMEAD